MKPRVFIGSSSESRRIAAALQRNLDDYAEVTLWNQDVFLPTELGLESLIDRLDQAQFAVFVLTADDLAVIRGQEVNIPRDNVLFELGLFMGRLGRERCFVVVPHDPSPHLPSDIAGLTVIGFHADRSDRNVVAATGSACERIQGAIEQRSSFLRAKAKETTDQILQVAARLIALRAGLNENQVRGFVHLFSPEEKCLVPVAYYRGVRQQEDAKIHIPCERDKDADWYIISRAFNDNSFQCAEVDWDKAKTEKIRHSRAVWKDLKSVVAHPVRPQDRVIPPIGTIAFDSSRELGGLGWQTDDDLEDILKLLAGTIFTVVTRVY